jgi:DNA repair protein RadC
VSVVTARKALGKFRSLHGIGHASFDELQALPGVGSKRATSIAALIHDEWPGDTPF